MYRTLARIALALLCTTPPIAQALDATPTPVTAYVVVDQGPQTAIFSLDPDSTTGAGSKVVNGSQAPFAYTPGPTPLGYLPGGTGGRANGTRAGAVVGYAGTGTTSSLTHAFHWLGGQMQDLGTTGTTDLFSAATQLNPEGTIVGYADNPARTASVPVVWDVGGEGPTILPTLGGMGGTALAVNRSGTIVGYSRTSDGKTHATLWPPEGNPIDLHSLGTQSFAMSINDAGQVIGYYSAPTGSRGFLWTPFPGAMIVLPPLNGDTQSQANAINAAGVVVGTSTGTTGFPPPVHAVQWVNGQPENLQPLVTTPGFVLTGVTGINNQGVIAVTGKVNGQARSALLLPQSPSM